MTVVPSSIPDVLLLKPEVFGDERGYFLESWNEQSMAKAGIAATFVQDNHSFSQQGTLRGLHHQPNHPQGKLVWVLEGEVLDVAVDLRKSSPTFGRWTSLHLTGANFLRAWIPPGFAHGFAVLSETAHFFYKCTSYYVPEDQEVIAWNDADLAIDWEIGDRPPILSLRDRVGCSFAAAQFYP